MVPFRQPDRVFAVRKDTSVRSWPYCKHSWDSSKSFAAGGSKLALGLVSREITRRDRRARAGRSIASRRHVGERPEPEVRDSEDVAG
jgi:hypothetical protein